ARVALTLVGCGLAVWGAVYVARTSFVVDGHRVFCLWDDAMISMTYARNLREGHGLVWNAGGEHVQGFSNLGVTLAVPALHALPPAPEHMALAFQALCLAALVATLFGVARLAGRDAAWTGVGAALFTALSAPLALWGLQGADAALQALWLVACAGVLSAPAP